MHIALQNRGTLVTMMFVISGKDSYIHRGVWYAKTTRRMGGSVPIFERVIQ